MVNLGPMATVTTHGKDEVDLIVAAWRREVPGLDVEPLRILSRLTRLARHLDLARRSAFAEHNLEVWEFDVISALRRVGRPYELSPGDLVKQTLSTSGTMTNRVDRLVGRGLVERRPDPDDRRGVRVRLTAEGCQLTEAALAGLLEHERGLLEGLGVAEREELADMLARLMIPFEG